MRKPFRTNIDSDLLRKLRIYAATEEINMNDLLEELLSKFFEGEIKVTPKKRTEK